MRLLIVFGLVFSILFAGCCGITSHEIRKLPVSELTGNCANVDLTPLHIVAEPNGSISVEGIGNLSLQGFEMELNALPKHEIYRCHAGEAEEENLTHIYLGSAAKENTSHVYCESYWTITFTNRTVANGKATIRDVEISDIEFEKAENGYRIYTVECFERTTVFSTSPSHTVHH
jgi:hypothetical protein